MAADFDLDPWLDRIHHTGGTPKTLQTLQDLHLAQVLAIPFENLDIQMGRGIPLAPDDLATKLVADRRGGYCFEANGLFALALRRLGFEIEYLQARVWTDVVAAGAIPPRDHQILLVHCDGREWLADVGFGGRGLLLPLPLEVGRTTTQFFECFRFALDPEHGSVLQWQAPDGSLHRLYTFRKMACHPIDYEHANYFLSTSPDSFFVKALSCSRATTKLRHTIAEDVHRIRDANGIVEENRIPDRQALLAILRDPFGIDLPDDTRLPHWERRRQDP